MMVLAENETAEEQTRQRQRLWPWTNQGETRAKQLKSPHRPEAALAGFETRHQQRRNQSTESG